MHEDTLKKINEDLNKLRDIDYMMDDAVDKIGAQFAAAAGGNNALWGQLKRSFPQAFSSAGIDFKTLKGQMYNIAKDIFGIDMGAAITEVELELALSAIANPNKFQSVDDFKNTLRKSIQSRVNRLSHGLKIGG